MGAGTALAAYNALLPAARLAVRLGALAAPKLAEGLRGRAGWGERLRRLAAAHAGNILWVHTTSVGEYEQARPLAALVADRLPELEILHTFFSPSGHRYALQLGEARHVEYLPEDTPDGVAWALDTLRPRALVVVKFDLWPNLVHAAHTRRVPVLLFDATLQPRSWRSRWPARALYRQVYRRLDVISAVSHADAARFLDIVADHPGVHVDGDTRYDQVLRRRAAARPAAIVPALLAAPRPFTLVAGSTWGPDEARLVRAWSDFMQDWKQTSQAAEDTQPRLIAVPHEPTPAHLRALAARVRRAGLTPRRYSEIEAGADVTGVVILVDRVGILAELYAAGDAAYVGGAFTTGVHSLLEPAIQGRALLFGPKHHNAPEAARLLEAGAGTVVRSALDIGRALASLAGDAERRRRMGAEARACVESALGASERCFDRLAGVLRRGAAPIEERA